MFSLIRKWWFWAIIVFIILILFFLPMKGCGILTYAGSNGPPTGSKIVYQTLFNYYTKGCPV